MKSVRPIFATKIPSSPPSSSLPGELYQPFRPPPSPLPQKYRFLGPVERIDILRNCLGLWHKYAPLISTLAHDGFILPSIEVIGISDIEQNRLVVATQFRDSLLSSSFDPDLLAFFDTGGGADLFYEPCFLNAT